MSDDSYEKYPIEVTNKFLEIQSKELDVRVKEAEVSASDLQNQKEIALASIEAQSRDREDGRRVIGQESTKSKVFAIVALCVVCVFIITLVVQGQAGMAQKLLEIAFTGGLGAFGGYGYAKWQARYDSEE